MTDLRSADSIAPYLHPWLIVILPAALMTAWLAAPVLAQESSRRQSSPEPGAQPPEEVSGDSPPPLAPLPIRYAEGWKWKVVTPQGAPGFVALAVGDDWAVAIDADGGVWRSRTGDTWYPVLPAPLSDTGPDEEALLLQAEAAMEDFFDASEVVDEDADEDMTGLEDVDPLGVQALAATDREQEDELPPVLSAFGELVLLSRGDGLWRSTDAGRSFRQTGERSPFTAFVQGPGGLLVGGTSSGLLYSLDGGRSWIDSDDALDGRSVSALSAGVSGTWYAVADGAVYTSPDAERWERLPLPAELGAVDAVLEDPASPGSLWLVSEGRLYRLERGRLDRLGQHPLGALSRLLVLDTPGHLLWAGGDGVWESRDGGITWRSVSAGLSQPLIADLAVAGSGPVAVSGEGILLLVEESPEENRGSTDTSRQVAVDYLLMLDRAMTRPGMDPNLHGTGARATVVRRLLPELVVRAQLSRDRELYAYYTGKVGDRYTGYNAAASRSDIYLQAELRWGGSSYSDGETSFDIADVTDQLFVLGETVYVDSPDATYTASAAANVTGRAATYQTRVGDELARLCADREQLLIEREGLRGGELSARVRHELAILEVNARIDAYTDGALDALLKGSPP